MAPFLWAMEKIKGMYCTLGGYLKEHTMPTFMPGPESPVSSKPQGVIQSIVKILWVLILAPGICVIALLAAFIVLTIVLSVLALIVFVLGGMLSSVVFGLSPLLTVGLIFWVLWKRL